MEWISVFDRLPIAENETHDQVWCLVFMEGCDISVHPFNVFHNVWDDKDGDDYFCAAIGGKITHWMPLPKPPKE